MLTAKSDSSDSQHSEQNTRGHGCKFRVPAMCVVAYSFFPIWNQLPADVVMSPSIEVFKSRLTGISATQTSIERHLSRIYLHVLSRFYQPQKLGFVGCFQHFMQQHICLTLKNVHYWKRETRLADRMFLTIREGLNSLSDFLLFCLHDTM